jgi:hypothetical protein
MWYDLFARNREPSAELASALADLDRLGRDRPELASPANTLAHVLKATFGVPPRLAHPYDFCVESPYFDDVERAWGSGGRAFDAYPPSFDSDDLLARSSATIKALKAENPAAALLSRAKIDWRDLALDIAWNNEAKVERTALDQLLPVELLLSVAKLTVMPVLASCSSELALHMPVTLASTARCPNCSRLPSLAESRGLEGQRILRCGVCAAGWPGPRLGCAACGERSATAVRSLFVEGEESRHRVVVCDSCGFRLKVISTLGPLSAPALIVAELATVHLDFI